MTEAQLQQQIFKWYHNTYCIVGNDPQHVCFSVPNESSNAKEQVYKKSLGLISGVSDLIILQPNRIIFVELKTQTGKQSENQKKFQKKVEALGFEYHLIRTLEQFKKIVK